MTQQPIDDLEQQLAQADEHDSSVAVNLTPQITLDNEADTKVVQFVAGKCDLDLPAITRDAAERLNIGLLYENVRIILSLQRQKEKIAALENQIYSQAGINPDKGLLQLYSFENNFYMQQVEYVRKYVLNNKSALDDLNADANELSKIFTQLSKDQIQKIKQFIATLRAESEVSEDNILESDSEEV